MKKQLAIVLAGLILIVVFTGRIYAAEYQELAAYWAPVICQDIDNDDVRAEYITRFDYDGDWIGNNNWDNLNDFDLPAYVYYWVIETETHYFIGYGFFHPRDWTNTTPGYVSTVTEHENDLEGILLTVKKSDVPDHEFGQFVSMVTVAHSDFFSYTEQDEYTEFESGDEWTPLTSPSLSIRGLYEDIDADMDFVVDDSGFHPVVYVQSEGHGVFGYKEGGDWWPFYSITDYPPVFDDNKITNWKDVDWTGIVAPPHTDNPSDIYNTSGWGDGIIYHYEGRADVPSNYARYGLTDYPHNWQVAGYNLVSIKEMWERRFDYKREKLTFDRYGTFDGNDGDHDGANSPWGWNDRNDGPVGRPDFFMNPVYLVSRYFLRLGTFSEIYTGCSFTNQNEYIIETRQPHQDSTGARWKWEIKLEEVTEVDIYIEELDIDNRSILDVRNGYDNSLIASCWRYDSPGKIVHAETNYLIIKMINLNDGDWGFSIRIEGNSPPQLMAEPARIEIDERSYNLNIVDYVDVIDPEGGHIDYTAEWEPHDSVAPWHDGPYDGILHVTAYDERDNATDFDVPITVNNVAPSAHCQFEEGEWRLIPGIGPVQLEPEEHNIHISFDDPGKYDFWWDLTIDFGDGEIEQRRVTSVPFDEAIHHPYNPGHYRVTVHVADKDGGIGWTRCEFDIRYTEDEARDINSFAHAEESRLAERLTIMGHAKEIKRMLDARGMEKPKIPEQYGKKPASQKISVLNGEKMYLPRRISNKNRQKKGLGLEF